MAKIIGISNSKQGELYPDEKIDAEVVTDTDGTPVYVMRYPRREWGKWRLRQTRYRKDWTLECRINGNYCPAYEVYPIPLSRLDTPSHREALITHMTRDKCERYDGENFRLAVTELIADGTIKNEGV